MAECPPMASISENRDEIRDLYARYCLYIDTGTPDEWAALFTTDGEFAGVGDPLVGSEALRSFAADTRAGGAGMHHVVSNVAVDVEGDEAAGTASVVIFIGGAPAIVGRYQDNLRREDGRWKFARRYFTADAPAS
jgi:uncharacterized protein (TIGR02246 family)